MSRRGEIENQLNDLAKAAPISFIFKKNIYDHEGRVISTIGSLEDDLDGNVVHLMSQNMQVSSFFLSSVMDGIMKTFDLNPDKFEEYIAQSPIIQNVGTEIFKTAYKYYINANYLVAVHLLIPQIEACVRKLVEITGGATLEPRRGGGFRVRALDSLLRCDEVKKSLGEDTVLYLRVVLTDQRGWNIRNDVSHGLGTTNKYSRNITDRLIHIVLVFAILRLLEDEQS
jgi:hypothetical protein